MMKVHMRILSSFAFAFLAFVFAFTFLTFEVTETTFAEAFLSIKSCDDEAAPVSMCLD